MPAQRDHDVALLHHFDEVLHRTGMSSGKDFLLVDGAELEAGPAEIDARPFFDEPLESLPQLRVALPLHEVVDRIGIGKDFHPVAPGQCRLPYTYGCPNIRWVVGVTGQEKGYGLLHQGLL